MYDHDDDYFPTQGEYMVAACREYARQHGALEPDSAWILTPFDTWEPNPCYNGPPISHPEFDED